MKNILVATDFSPNAHIAAICAGELTCRMGGRLIIFHALSPEVRTGNEAEQEERMSVEEKAQKKLDILAYELYSRFNISVSRLVKPGRTAEKIASLASRLNPELVVMGAQGEKHCPERTLSRLASELLLNSRFPLVCVPGLDLLTLGRQLALILKQPQPLCNSIGFTLLNELNEKLSSEQFLPH